MSEPLDWNAKTIAESRGNEGRRAPTMTAPQTKMPPERVW